MKTFKSRLIIFLLLAFNLNVSNTSALEVINIKPIANDMTPIIRNLLANVKDKDIKLIFEAGTYKFLPNLAKERYCFITNHENGLKRIIFDFQNFNSVQIEGNNAKFIFHGLCAPFVFDNCSALSMNNLTIDWDTPFDFLGEVVDVNPTEGWRDIKPINIGVNWTVQNGQLKFPNIDGLVFLEPGHTLAFDAKTKAVAYGAWDINSKPSKVEKLKNGNLRFHEKLRRYPTIGSLLNSSGVTSQNRYSAAVWGTASKNILLQSVIINYSLGMGFMFEKCENVTLKKCGVYLPDNTNRVVASNADATHFCNCKGDILIEDCRFENMLDDGTNVHGAYAIVDKIINKNTLRTKFGHFQQKGFSFANVSDKIWFVQQPNTQRGVENEVSEVNVINDEYTEIVFKSPLPKDLKTGDILENKTWNPTFTMRNSVVRNNRARSIVLKSPLKIVIENNVFSSMMSAILLRGETFFWYESGAVNDLLIQNNRFINVAHGGPEHAVLNIAPRLGKSFNQSQIYDQNIKFINNKIETFDNRIVWANRVNNLLIKGNTIKRTFDFPQQYPNAPMFDFTNCKNIQLADNTVIGSYPQIIKTDETSKSTLKVSGNKGF
ncbi:MAG TPA: right-handed parallel beta-helix repeat-containing protein [Pelobium sp.]|nr:right-handed parallel beta-helix repeat-containing protein [Pelobium sp.]